MLASGFLCTGHNVIQPALLQHFKAITSVFRSISSGESPAHIVLCGLTHASPAGVVGQHGRAHTRRMESTCKICIHIPGRYMAAAAANVWPECLSPFESQTADQLMSGMLPVDSC